MTDVCEFYPSIKRKRLTKAKQGLAKRDEMNAALRAELARDEQLSLIDVADRHSRHQAQSRKFREQGAPA
jgi:hypothetical protein